MASYKTVTRLTDGGPYIIKLILELPAAVGENDVTPAGFNIYCTRRERDGSVLMRKERGSTLALPSVGYIEIEKAYPCTETGRPVLRSNFVALEFDEVRLGKTIEGDVLASRTLRNEFRVTQLRALPAPSETEPPMTGLVFETCSGDLCPELCGWKTAEAALRYGYFTPKNEDKKKLPLVLWLHGAGEGGTETEIAYTGNRVTAFSSAEVQRKLGGAAWVLVPQCPTVWMDDGKEILSHSNQSIYVKPLKACLDNFLAEHADEIDTDRLYITGISNGGFMTVRMLADYPGLFAAAAPGCEAFFDDNITEEMLKDIAKTPIWLTHAKRDELVNPWQTALPLYNRLKRLGVENVHFTFLDEVIDPTGQYKDELGRPKVLFNHGVWVPMLDDAIRTELDGTRVLYNGEPCTLWEWMGKQHK